MTDWFDNGCDACRRSVLSTDWNELDLCITSVPRHARLWRCRRCEAWWEENEREAHVISDAEARRDYPEQFA